MGNSEGKKYWHLDGLEEIYLEDSYVLGIEKSKHDICFDLELVLCKTHPLYDSPPSHHRYCYKGAILIFENVTRLKRFNLDGMSIHMSVDPDGSVDFGNIDTFEILNENEYRLTGDWGEIELRSDKPIVTYI